MKKRVLLTLFLFVLCASPALAQQQKGDTELQFQGALRLSFDDDVDDQGTLTASWGRFFTDNQEVGAAILTQFDSDGDLAGYGGPFYRYNFIGRDDVVPYVGAASFFSFGDIGAGDVLLTGEGGVRWFLERNIAFSVAGVAYYDVDESDLADFLTVQFGFSYFWD